MNYILGKIKSFFSAIISFFSSFKLKPIDYNEGKTEPEKYYNNILPDIYSNLDKNGKFVDPYFPTNSNSLTSKKNPLINYNQFLESKDEKTKKEWKERLQKRDEDIKNYEDYLNKGIIRWERISDILKKNKKK